MKYVPFFCGIFFFEVCLSASPSLPAFPEASSHLFSQLSVYPQEKVYVHTDKDFYVAGDTLWFRAYVVDASTHEILRRSKYVYVELQSHDRPASGDSSPSPVRLRIAEREGLYAGYFALPVTAKSGDYTLTAYTGFMRNAGESYFFRKNIHVGAYGQAYSTPEERRSLERSFEVGFYPEGGYLVNGVRCCIGFKALRSDGTSAPVWGRITDERGVEAATFSSVHAGLGKVYFMPAAGRTYTAECTNAVSGDVKRFKLPAPRTEACVVQVFPASERFTVGLAASPGYNTSDLRLLIHCRGRLCYCEAWDGSPLTFLKNDFPDGVLQLLLLDKQGNSLSERLVFCYNDRAQPELRVSTDKPRYGRREKVSVALTCKDTDGTPLSGNVSVSVTDNRMVSPYRPSDIRTSLLLESELRGYIEDPAFYFDESHPENLAQTDALMLTQGWRRYDIPAVLKGNYTQPAEPLEIGQEITGRIRKTGLLRKRNFKGYKVDMLAPRQGVFATAEVDSAGCFVLNGFDLPDSALCVLRASGKDNKEDIELLIDEPQYPQSRLLPVPDQSRYMSRYNENLALFTDSLKNILIEEVIIRATPRKIPQTPYEVLAAKSVDYDKIEKEGYSSLRELLRRNGVMEIGKGFSYRGLPVVFVIDGLIQENRSSGLYEIEHKETATEKTHARLRTSWIPISDSPVDNYSLMPIDMIGHVDIIPPVNTVLFGSQVGRAAVVCITTKNGSELLSKRRDDLDRLNMKVFDPSGYQKPVEFYSPKYETLRQQNAPERDLRTTLYWNPNVQITPDGHAAFEFYTADEPADYTIDIEGILETKDNSTQPKILHYENKTEIEEGSRN